MPSAIPDRWLNYKPIGRPIEGTRFIAFKVPLKENVNERVDEQLRLDKGVLLEKIPNLGMIIDLTNTDRYYNAKHFVDAGIEHKKLNVPGHVTPSPQLIHKFKNHVSDFLQKNSDNDKLIGVHCTHGVNRTGFLICNYMISEMAMEPQEAINKFNTARGHTIERSNYLKALNKMKPPPSRRRRRKGKEEDYAVQTSYRRKSNFRNFVNDDNSQGNNNSNQQVNNWRSNGNNRDYDYSYNSTNQPISERNSFGTNRRDYYNSTNQVNNWRSNRTNQEDRYQCLNRTTNHSYSSDNNYYKRNHSNYLYQTSHASSGCNRHNARTNNTRPLNVDHPADNTNYNHGHLRIDHYGNGPTTNKYRKQR